MAHAYVPVPKCLKTLPWPSAFRSYLYRLCTGQPLIEDPGMANNELSINGNEIAANHVLLPVDLITTKVINPFP
jgi:hypothetical protein